MVSLFSVALIRRMKITTCAEHSAPSSARLAPEVKPAVTRWSRPPCGSIISSTPAKPATTAAQRYGPTCSCRHTAARRTRKIGATKLKAVMSASGRRASAAKLRNIEQTPTSERAKWKSGRLVCTTCSGLEVYQASANSGTSANRARKKITSPTGAGPASLITAYIKVKASVAPSFSAMPVEVECIGLEPAAPLEPDIGHHGGDDHHDDGQRIAQRPGELRHEAEVHAPDRSEQGRGQEHHSRHRHDLDDVVLLVVDEAQSRVLDRKSVV